ncbi:hypothetical protein LSAT2_001344 [Lamellibrachia satsuma]|nr:hypothetical protein LSAT2_001344 [Lamellibrachia satsuma]
MARSSFAESYLQLATSFLRRCWQSVITRMKVFVFFVAICVFTLVVPQTYAKKRFNPTVRKATAYNHVSSICSVGCWYNSCKIECHRSGCVATCNPKSGRSSHLMLETTVRDVLVGTLQALDVSRMAFAVSYSWLGYPWRRYEAKCPTNNDLATTLERAR